MNVVLKGHPVSSHTVVGERQAMAKLADLEERFDPHLPHFVVIGICSGYMTMQDECGDQAYPLFYRIMMSER